MLQNTDANYKNKNNTDDVYIDNTCTQILDDNKFDIDSDYFEKLLKRDFDDFYEKKETKQNGDDSDAIINIWNKNKKTKERKAQLVEKNNEAPLRWKPATCKKLNFISKLFLYPYSDNLESNQKNESEDNIKKLSLYEMFFKQASDSNAILPKLFHFEKKVASLGIEFRFEKLRVIEASSKSMSEKVLRYLQGMKQFLFDYIVFKCSRLRYINIVIRFGSSWHPFDVIDHQYKEVILKWLDCLYNEIVFEILMKFYENKLKLRSVYVYYCFDSWPFDKVDLEMEYCIDGSELGDFKGMKSKFMGAIQRATQFAVQHINAAKIAEDTQEIDSPSMSVISAFHTNFLY